MKKREKNNTVKIVLPDTIKQDELSSILAEAIVKAQDIQVQRENEREKEIKDEVSNGLNQTFSIVDIPEKKGIKKSICTFINNTWFVIAFPFKRFDTSKDNRFIRNSVKQLLTFLLTLLQGLLVIADAYGIIYWYQHFTFEKMCYFIALIAMVHLLLGICHGVKLEITNMKDCSLLFNIASLLVSVSALIISFVLMIHGW